MTAVGHNDTLWTNLSVLATGVPQDFANKAAMTGAGYALNWYDDTGTALASQPVWDLERSETNGDHLLSYAVPLGVFAIRMTVPVTDYATIALWNGIGYSYGPDDIGAMIASSGGVTIAPTITSDTHTMYDGDSINVVVSVTDAALVAIGAASLAACDTKRANIKLDSANSGAVPTVPYGDLTVTILTDTPGNYTLRVSKDAFPVALAVQNDNKSVACTLQLELGEGAKLLTVASVAMTILWVSKDGAL